MKGRTEKLLEENVGEHLSDLVVVLHLWSFISTLVFLWQNSFLGIAEYFLFLNQEHDNSHPSFLHHHNGVCAALADRPWPTHQDFSPSCCSATTHFVNCSSAALNCYTLQGKWGHRFDFWPSLPFYALVPLWKFSVSFLLGLETRSRVLWPIFRMT